MYENHESKYAESNLKYIKNNFPGRQDDITPFELSNFAAKTTLAGRATTSTSPPQGSNGWDANLIFGGF